jgi:hypothetical protein
VNWKTKARLLWAFDRLPFGVRLYVLTQQYVTRKVPKAHQSYALYLSRIETYANTFERYGVDLPTARYLEFGAGWDLIYPLGLWCRGLNHQLILDLYPLARRKFLNHTLKGLSLHPPPGAVRLPISSLGNDWRRDLADHYGIIFQAPADARKVDLPTGSVDLVCTTSTLEHIPRDALVAIMSEMRRVSSPGAIVAMMIDLSDHYSHDDTSITPYNYLRFSPEEWAAFNPPIRYLNRMRLSQYRTLFEQTSFKVLEERHERPDEWEALLKRQPLHDDFRDLDPDDVAVTSALFVLRAP